ncbi:hypothetical protein OC861_006176 [Tilletia horrida]|nr:hypothetical protein OC861_006176 [Tilletia horrida]
MMNARLFVRSSLTAAAAARRVPTLSVSQSRLFSASIIVKDDAALLDKIKTQLKDAMRAKDSSTSTVLRSLLSEYQYAQKQPNNANVSLSSVLQKAVAKRVEAAAQFRAATPAPRTDLADKEDTEAKLIQTFLPEPMTRAELESVVQEVVDQVRSTGTEAKKLVGQVMKALNAKLDKARVSGGGAEISKVVNEVLSKASS